MQLLSLFQKPVLSNHLISPPVLPRFLQSHISHILLAHLILAITIISHTKSKVVMSFLFPSSRPDFNHYWTKLGDNSGLIGKFENMLGTITHRWYILRFRTYWKTLPTGISVYCIGEKRNKHRGSKILACLTVSSYSGCLLSFGVSSVTVVNVCFMRKKRKWI